MIPHLWLEEINASVCWLYIHFILIRFHSINYIRWHNNPQTAWCRAFRRQTFDLNRCWVMQNLVECEKQAWNLSPLKRDGFENGDTVMTHGYALWCAAPQISTHTDTHTHTPLQMYSIRHESRFVPCGLNSHWATGFFSCLNTIYIFLLCPLLPFSPHFLHSVTSYRSPHDKTQDYLQSPWPLFDSGLVQDGV